MGVDASEDEMNKMGVGELVLLGSGLGVLHVFTGLDHVAAIMTISVPPAPSPARGPKRATAVAPQQVSKTPS